MATEYKTLPIGTIFTYNGNKYKVCKDEDCRYTCNKCAFNGINCNTIKGIRGNCIFGHRTDHAQIYYVQINDETMNKYSNNSIIITTIFNTNDSLNDLHIECPKGYSIDVEHSDLSKGIIRFKKDNIILEDIYENQGKNTFIINVVNNNKPTYSKISAIATLMDIANYYNKGWKPDLNNGLEPKYFIVFDYDKNYYYVEYKYKRNNGNIFFRNKVDAQAVIDNPNFKDILDSIYKY